MPDQKIKWWLWTVCSKCSGDGLSNMVNDEDGNTEEGVCPMCEGKGWIKAGGYVECNVTQLKGMLGL